MPSEHAYTGESAKGLPTVVPPSGKFIAQLFLVPFLIVMSIVCFLLVINWLVGGERTAEDFLKKINDPNPDIRWRGAEALAQVLQRDEKLAANPAFGLDLAERLKLALQNTAIEEKASQERLKQSSDPATLARETKALQANRDFVLYLSACLGSFSVPVGAPMLSELTLHTEGTDARTLTHWRRGTVWILAKLGEKVRGFNQLPTEQQQAILSALDAEASMHAGSRGQWAAASRDFLQGPQAKSIRLLSLDKAMAHGADDSDPFIRELVAFALGFWDGSENEQALIDGWLLKLAHDDGRGEESLLTQKDEKDSEDDAITKVPGLRIRANAVLALAQRGSKQLRLAALKELMDESYLRESFLIRRKNGKEIPDENLVSKTLEAATHAVVALHKKDPERDLAELYPSLEALAGHKNMNLRTEAIQAQMALGRR